MKGLSESASLISWQGPIEGYYYVEIGINGIKAVPFSFPATHLDSIKDEESLGQYLERQGRALIERYGDARDPRPDSLVSESETLAYNELHNNGGV